MDIPLNVDVQCTEGICGQSTYVIVHPASKKVTHVVVQEPQFPHTEYMVPVERIVESTPERILLDCTRQELADLDPFIETEYVEGDLTELEYGEDDYRMWPYALPENDVIPIEYERVPPGELAIHRGAHVRATDGPVGRVDEFLIDPANEHITHLVLREGHLWGQKDVTIPISEIDRFEKDIVYLKLDKEQIEALPTIAVRRRQGRP
jgi:sporulation protein YlmC with PRC-barrel domain